jgi:hypothetical protein
MMASPTWIYITIQYSMLLNFAARLPKSATRTFLTLNPTSFSAFLLGAAQCLNAEQPWQR